MTSSAPRRRDAIAEQPRLIVAAAAPPNITVQVIPFDQGRHIALNGPFVLLDFANARTIVHLEHRRSSLFLDEVAPYVEMPDSLQEVALDPARLAEFLVEVAAERER